MRLVINAKCGGFGLSETAVRRYLQIKGVPVWVENRSVLGGALYWLAPAQGVDTDERERFDDRNLERDDPVLLQVVEELGDAASGRFAQLKIVEIPDGVKWKIYEREGEEWIAEEHRTWR